MLTSLYKPDPLTVVELHDARNLQRKFDLDGALPLGVCIAIWSVLAAAGWGVVYLLFRLI